jgi:hypothetical protein
MGLSSLLSSLVKGLTWTQVAGLAMEYGPELCRKAMERFQPVGSEVAAAEEHELKERLARLEKLLLEQEGIIRKETAKAELLEERCLALEGRLQRLKIVAGLLATACLILLAFLCR